MSTNDKTSTKRERLSIDGSESVATAQGAETCNVGTAMKAGGWGCASYMSGGGVSGAVAGAICYITTPALW